MATPNETSPLLASEHIDVESSAIRNDIPSCPETATHKSAGDYFQQPIKTITTQILFVSLATFIILVASTVLINGAPFRSVPYSTPHVLELAIVFVVIAFVAALVNRRTKIPFLFNVLIDIFLIWSIFYCVPLDPGISFPRDSWCEAYWSPEDPITSVCHNFVLAGKVLLGIGLGLGILLWSFHIALLAIRCVAAWKSEFWRQPAGLMIPGGELTFQFTIKLLRQETGHVVPGASHTVVSSLEETQEGDAH